MDSFDRKPNVYFIIDPNKIGVMTFTFDGKKTFNLFQDYPNKLSPIEKDIFDKQFPFWKEFFKDRKYDKGR